MRLRLSDGQRKHLANTARIIGVGGFVIYGVPEIRLKAVDLGLLIFGTSELLAALVLRGVNS